MTLIPKSIASDTVIFSKWQYRLRYLFVLFFIACIVFVINLILNGVSEGWFGFLILLMFTYQFGIPYNQKILEFCEVVIDNHTHLTVIKNGVHEDIFYDNIASITHEHALFWLNKYVVKIQLKYPTKIGSVIYFMGWQDNNGGNHTLGNETQAWINALNKKINAHTTQVNP